MTYILSTSSLHSLSQTPARITTKVLTNIHDKSLIPAFNIDIHFNTKLLKVTEF